MSAWNDYYMAYGGGRQALAAQQSQQQSQAAQDQLMARYGQMNQQVQAGIRDVGTAQRASINDAYLKQVGDTTQSATSRGLGNTTVVDALQRGNRADKSRADIALSSQLAQLSAGYTSEFGMAGLQSQTAYNQRQQQFGQQQALAQQQYGYQAALSGQQFDQQRQLRIPLGMNYGGGANYMQTQYGSGAYNPWANAGRL